MLVHRPPFERVVVIICDSVGCGLAPDAADFGDRGANTLASVITGANPRLVNLSRLGLDQIVGVPALRGGHDSRGEGPTAAWGRLTERSAAKDTLTGHWELMGIESSEAFPLYPDGFPEGLIGSFEATIGRRTIGNRPDSGIRIIQELGSEHLESGAPIIYTSGDSVFQIAAHEEVIPVDQLYEMCVHARRLLVGQYRVARVIARPFIGSEAEGFERTPRRRDYPVPPPRPTCLDRLVEAGRRTFGVGKIHDIFAGRGLTGYAKTKDNADGVAKTCAALRDDQADFIFTNLVDFDSEYGHRRDVAGYARALEAFDALVPDLLAALGPNDCLMISADHGNDPAFKGTDHTRERVPLLVSSRRTVPRDLGTRASFADLGRTVLENFGIIAECAGDSFLAEIAV